MQWLGTYPGAVELDGYLRWAFCSWPANPNADATFDSWVCRWRAGGTFLHYPESPSLRWLSLKNGLNLSEKVLRLRAEGRIDARLQSVLDEYAYEKGRFPSASAAADLFERTSREIQRACDPPISGG